jgi:hypothetical protein
VLEPGDTRCGSRVHRHLGRRLEDGRRRPLKRRSGGAVPDLRSRPRDVTRAHRPLIAVLSSRVVPVSRRLKHRLKAGKFPLIAWPLAVR